MASLLTVGALSFAGPHLGVADEHVPRPTTARLEPLSRGGAPASARVSGGRARSSIPRFDVDPAAKRIEDGAYVVDIEGRQTAVLTLHEGLQSHMEAYFARYGVPAAGLVALEPSSGRVLAYVSHRGRESAAVDMARDASAPAASIFKIVTGAALLEAGVSPSERVCYHGGDSRIGAALLDPNPALDRQCATLAEAMGGSINVVFARLADRHLDARALERQARAFGFGQELPFDLSTTPSSIEVPTDRLEFARTSAGFWHTRLSPLHGALIAASIANGGIMPRAGVVERIIDAGGRVVHRFEPEAHRRVVSSETAASLDRMMRLTVTRGTSRRAFHDERGRPFLPGIAVAGKTGTLSEERPYRGYTWWVGFAPADRPTIALGVLVVNTPEWRIKASHAAVEALRYWLVSRREARESSLRGS